MTGISIEQAMKNAQAIPGGRIVVGLALTLFMLAPAVVWISCKIFAASADLIAAGAESAVRRIYGAAE